MKQLRNVIKTIGLAALLTGCNFNPCIEELPTGPQYRTGKVGEIYCVEGREVPKKVYDFATECLGGELKTDMAAMRCIKDYLNSGR